MSQERTIKKWLVPGKVIEEFSTRHGYSWELQEVEEASVEVFWHEQAIYIRQESDRTRVDMVELSVGQAYDMIKTLGRALDVGAKN